MIVLTLSSDSSSKIYPDNEPGNFKTYLPSELQLPGDAWMIGLVRMQFPKSWPTLMGTDCDITISKPPPLLAKISVKIKEGNFSSISALIAHINNLIAVEGRKLPTTMVHGDEIIATKFILHSDNRVRIETYNDIIIKTSKRLQQVLGLQSNDIRTPHVKDNRGKLQVYDQFTTHIPDILMGLNLLWVYCDIIREPIVSDIKAPLLTTVSTNSAESDDFISYEPKTIDWHKPSTSRIQSIHTTICDVNGNVVDFNHGQVIITLHIEQRSHNHGYFYESLNSIE